MECNYIKDKNIFIYKYDNIINEIIKELIKKQQSKMDFSKNVKLNEINNNIDNELFFQKKITTTTMKKK